MQAAQYSYVLFQPLTTGTITVKVPEIHSSIDHRHIEEDPGVDHKKC
jgi:hypothetical protein